MKIKLLLIFIFYFINTAYSQVAVIANKSVPISEISASQLLDFYTGDERFWNDENPVIVFDLKTKGALKETFYKYLGKSSSRMKSIWMKKLLSGEGDPPPALESESEMLDKIEKTKGAIGFVNYKSVSKKVKILTIIEQ